MESPNAFLTSKSRKTSLTIIDFYSQNPSKINEKSEKNRSRRSKSDFFRVRTSKNQIWSPKVRFENPTQSTIKRNRNFWRGVENVFESWRALNCIRRVLEGFWGVLETSRQRSGGPSRRFEGVRREKRMPKPAEERVPSRFGVRLEFFNFKLSFFM